MTSAISAATARRALEEVCSGKNLGGIPDVYHPEFVDHVNGLEYRGHSGARRSVAKSASTVVASLSPGAMLGSRS